MTESYYKEQTIRGKHSLIHSSPTIQRSMSLARPILTTSRRIHCQAVWGQNVALRCSSTDASQTDALGVPELSNHLAEEFDLSKAESKRIVTSLFDYIAESLKEKKKVSVSNFGSFSTYHSEERQGRNPSNGQPMTIPAKERVKFTAFKALKENVNK